MHLEMIVVNIISFNIYVKVVVAFLRVFRHIYCHRKNC